MKIIDKGIAINIGISLLLVAGLLTLSSCKSKAGDGNGDLAICSKCDSTADCNAGLTCSDFYTGPNRCAAPNTNSCSSTITY